MTWKKLKNRWLILFNYFFRSARPNRNTILSRSNSKILMQKENSKLLVITAPSGSGKTTIVRHLLETFDNLSFSVSATTRSPREGEIHGKDYYFFEAEEFKNLIEEEAFVEWEEVYPDKFYGTLKSEVQRVWNNGKHIIFDIDVKGAVNIKKRYGEQALSIFIKPPSFEVLCERLQDRATEDSKSLETRLARAKKELTFEKKFDIVIINDDLVQAKKEATNIVELFFKTHQFSTI